ncbi:Ger(x)C family spore germination protein [Candidatus Clostridium radicumherbarum]|uniref:Ger(X)C family spore germination protein n=1 Tax=Candidatus Clostridium radicumherbarum TaxID=3381662 RepID=A0ABW8TVB1_9CLOT
MRFHRYVLASLIIIAIIAYFLSGVYRVPVEKVSVASAIGYDLEETIDGITIHSVPITTYNTQEKVNSSTTEVSKGLTLAQTRESRQNRIDKKFLLGFERVYIVSETMGTHGIKEIADVLIHHPQVNDTSLICVCKGKAEDIMKMKIEGYPSSGDFIEGLIKSSQEYNFYSKNYKLIDVALRISAEGRNIVIPYIEAKDGSIIMAGLALFHKEKLVKVVDIQETKTLNLLRENNVTGMITTEDTGEKYVNFFGKSKRKVQCLREDNNYRFIINLSITGDVTANEKYEDIINHPEIEKEIEEALAKKVKGKCERELQKIKSEYKIDCLELGRVAAAKYGRDTGTDWDKVITSSPIEVNVKVKIDKVGRAEI